MKKSNLYTSIIFLLFIICLKSNSLELEGNFTQGGLVFGKLENNAKVYFDDQNIPVDKDGNFLFGFKRKHKSQSIIKVIYDSGKILSKKINISERRYKIQKINNLDQNKVTPPKSYYDRIKKETALIKKAKKIFFNLSYYKAGFIMPVEGIITGVYGSQRILNGEPKRPHYGIDIANKKGTSIVSPSDGIVVLVENNLYFSGGTIIISHGLGLTSSLLHLSEILVKVGEKVHIGQEIGKVGSTGRSTGPHLDWRMEINGTRVDPQLLINYKKKL